MNISNSYKIWIEAGYNQFAIAGLDGIQVERLARITHLNKSGFYHYFGDRETFLEQLMKHHYNVAITLANEIHQIQHIDPDFFTLLIKYRTPVIAHMQMVRNRQHILLNEHYQKVNNLVDLVIAPYWAKYLNMHDNVALAHRYFEQARDAFYSRISFENMNEEFLRNFFQEAKTLVTEIQRSTARVDL
jgi:AcrR family transcriptional regulator